MIFILRVILFSTLILLGLHVSTRSIRLRKIVTVIYTFVFLWYTLLCRLPLFTSVAVAADSTITTTPVTELSFAERLIEGVIAIFGPQPDGTLAGDGGGKGDDLQRIVVCADGLSASALVPQASKEFLACCGNLHGCQCGHRTAPGVDRTRYG